MRTTALAIAALLITGIAFAQTEADVVAQAAHVTPTARQLAWQDLEFAAFVHFGMNTFTDREWGEGHEDPTLFNPTDFDARQWIAACKEAGVLEVIVTAKHHDGFCLWPSAYTQHSVKSSPWRDGKGDVVREVADACHEAGLKFGVYLSPWDRTEQTYGDSPAYNEYFENQLRELAGNYGEVAEFWFDGACGEGPNGKRQEYDWPGYFAVIHELQPNAVISICGPDVRWCGNEAGSCRPSEWSVIPVSIAAGEYKKGVDTVEVLYGFNPQAEDLGSRQALLDGVKKGMQLAWYPAQVDTSIRPGWFYHQHDDGKVKPLSQLLDIYYSSVGGNAQLLLNIPPDKRGRIHENDVQRLKELGAVLRATFDHNLAAGAAAKASAALDGHAADATLDGDKTTYWTTADGVTTAEIEYDLGAPQKFNRAQLQECIAQGQRIEACALDAWDDAKGDWRELAKATTVGYKRLFRFDDVTAQRVRVRVIDSRVAPTLSSFGLFYEPPMVAAPAIKRDKAGMVTIEAQPGMDVRYWLANGKSAASGSQQYTGPFALPQGGVVKAIAVPPDNSRYVSLGGLAGEAEFGASKGNWKIVGDAGATAANAIDEDSATSFVCDADKPHELVIDLGESREVAGFEYLPRQDSAEGRVNRCAIYISDDPAAWGEPAATGEFGNIVNNPVLQTVRMQAPVKGRYVRFVALEEASGGKAMSAAEIGVILAGVEPPAQDKKALWETLQPDAATQTVKRVTDAYPLSDQENKGNWALYAPMTDEFEGPALDAAKWWDHNPGWLGRQPALFWPGNVTVSDGKLNLAMKTQEAPDMPRDKGYRDYTSAAVKSKDTVRYGYFEVKARPMNSAGSSSFWFYDGKDGWWTEIDVFEIGARAKNYERKMNITVHVMDTPVTDDHQQIGGAWVAPFDLADDYHVYGLEWDDKELKFYFDGMLVRKGVNTDWHQPLTLNFDSETMPEWFGLPEDKDLPSTYSIEYVRCWKKGE